MILPVRRLPVLAALMAGLLVQPLHAEGAAGAYLAARYASFVHDYAAEASYFPQALAQDPKNLMLMEGAVAADVAVGDFKAAVPVAQAFAATKAKSSIVNIVILADLLKRGAYDRAIAQLKQGDTVGPLVDGLATAWAELGAGRMSDALANFDRMAKSPGLKDFSLYHKALAMASAGDFGGAAKIFQQGGGAIQVSRRAIIAYAEILSQLGRDPEALKLLDAKFGPEVDPGIDPLRARLNNGETLPFTVVRNARDGLAEVFYTVASALKSQADPAFTLIYARIAQYLRPDDAEATLLVAGLLESQRQYALALAAYSSVSRGDPAYYVAEQGRAQALYASGQVDAGITAMQALAKSHPKLIDVQIALGDLLRQQDRFDEAITAYTAAVGLISNPQPGDWVVYYMRGISYERAGKWDKAEQDLRMALTLNPNQPDVLNYLGYGLVERGSHLNEALGMLKRAVAGRPDDGYIVDSLAWVYYKIGQYAKALPLAERAVGLMPVDAVVTDHLGDILWAVGRHLEARFQWHRALSFNPSPEEAARIRLKLEKGLDAVLKAEGAPPLKSAKNGG